MVEKETYEQTCGQLGFKVVESRDEADVILVDKEKYSNLTSA
jgi:hypothetical protein